MNTLKLLRKYYFDVALSQAQVRDASSSIAIDKLPNS